MQSSSYNVLVKEFLRCDVAETSNYKEVESLRQHLTSGRICRQKLMDGLKKLPSWMDCLRETTVANLVQLLTQGCEDLIQQAGHAMRFSLPPRLSTFHLHEEHMQAHV